VLYDDIRVEDARGWLIDFKILNSQYTKDKQHGRIENVLFKNIQVEGEHLPYSQLIGFDEKCNISGVVLDGFYLHGTRINSTYNGLISTKYADIKFK